MEERLQKLLALAGLGSRRACEAYLLQHRVRVNGVTAELGQKADPERDEITVDGEPLARPEKLAYVLLYKPRGVVSSLEPQGDRGTVRELVPAGGRLYPVGRLDLDSEGLILLTNDGALTNLLTHPRYETEKEYRVLVAEMPRPQQLEAWQHGVVVEDKRTAPAQVSVESHTPEGVWLRVVMHEGRKHEIRNIAQTLGLWVHRLIRVRLGSLKIGALRPGQWRVLTPQELRDLQHPPRAEHAKSGRTRAPYRSSTAPRRSSTAPRRLEEPPEDNAPRRRKPGRPAPGTRAPAPGTRAQAPGGRPHSAEARKPAPGGKARPAGSHKSTPEGKRHSDGAYQPPAGAKHRSGEARKPRPNRRPTHR